MGGTDRANVYDCTAVILRKKLLAFLPQTIHQAEGVYTKHLMEHFVGHIRDCGVVVHDTRIIHCHIQTSKGVYRFFNHLHCGFGIAHITGIPGHFA